MSPYSSLAICVIKQSVVAFREFRIISSIVLILMWFGCSERKCIVLLVLYGGRYHIEVSACVEAFVGFGILTMVMFRYLIEGKPCVVDSVSVVVPIPLSCVEIRSQSVEILDFCVDEFTSSPLEAIRISSTYLLRREICMPIFMPFFMAFIRPSAVTISAKMYESWPPIVKPLDCL